MFFDGFSVFLSLRSSFFAGFEPYFSKIAIHFSLREQFP